ncbi:MAG: hypothetical protein ACHQT8_01850 [Chlamydiales bacterium]
MSLKVFGSNDLNQAICGFLNAGERVNLSMVDRGCHTNVRAFEKEERRLLAYRQVFAVGPTRELILSWLSPVDQDRCKRVNRSYNKQISSFQPRQIHRLLPPELQQVAARATFQNFYPMAFQKYPRGLTRFPEDPSELSASIVIGYAGELPYLACRANIIYTGGGVQKTVLVAIKGIPGADWFVHGYAGSEFRSSLEVFAEFMRSKKMTFGWSQEAPRNCCLRICDLFRRICCGVVQPKVLLPQLHLV